MIAVDTHSFQPIQRGSEGVEIVDQRRHRPECADTSGTFVEAPALNLKANQETARQTIEKMA